MQPFLTGPLVLSADRFTSLSRTPWAGDKICKNYKNLTLPQMRGNKVGEAWEFSCDPELLSTVPSVGTDLASLIARYPEELLSTKAQGKCEILVKLLDTAKPLSLQIHPTDDDPALAPNECGKPESWYILDHEPGAGLYLGFKKPLSRDQLRQILKDGSSAKDFLYFVPVKQGDYFEISAGTPHAIGAGITLLEPQRIIQGKSGKTYRLWDWGRLYDDKGNETSDAIKGKSRELHIEQGLKLFDPGETVGDEYVRGLRRQALNKEISEGLRVKFFPKNAHYQVVLLDFEGHKNEKSVRLNIADGYGSMTMLKGRVGVLSKVERVTEVIQGQTCFLPHSAMPMILNLREETRIAFVIPAHSELDFLGQ